MSGGNLRRQQGLLDLRLERSAGHTRPVRSQAQPPLQLSRARYDDPAAPEQISLTLIHLGGILAGDRYRLDVALGPDAQARIGTAAATQVYRMPGDDAAQELRIELAAGSRLLWLPEPLILFGGANFAQTTCVVLAPGSRLALLEVVAPGRLARGEAFQFERYAARLEVLDPAGRCLVAERAVLEPRRRPLAVPGVLGSTPVWGSLYLLGDTVAADRISAAIHALGQPDLASGALPGACGLVVRALGSTPHSVARRLLDVLHRIDRFDAVPEPG